MFLFRNFAIADNQKGSIRKIIGIRKKEMKQLKENEGIERSLLLAMAVIAGLTVANCYYNQPLLEMIRHDIGVSQHEANLITVVTQIGYALGLCFLIPMGDLYSRRRIIICLLYTSPSPRDRQKSRMPSSA